MGITHGVRRLSDGRVRVRLSQREHELLRSLPEQLRAVLAGEDVSDELRARLFPRIYEDPVDELEHREAAGDALAVERLTAVETFARTLERGHLRAFGWSVELEGDEAEAWLSAVNDARLALGVVLGISDESEWEQGPHPDNPASVALWYLGWLEEQLVQVLLLGLPVAGDDEDLGSAGIE